MGNIIDRDEVRRMMEQGAKMRRAAGREYDEAHRPVAVKLPLGKSRQRRSVL